MILSSAIHHGQNPLEMIKNVLPWKTTDSRHQYSNHSLQMKVTNRYTTFCKERLAISVSTSYQYQHMNKQFPDRQIQVKARNERSLTNSELRANKMPCLSIPVSKWIETEWKCAQSHCAYDVMISTQFGGYKHVSVLKLSCGIFCSLFSNYKLMTIIKAVCLN
jgi:hypothetical protein